MVDKLVEGAKDKQKSGSGSSSGKKKKVRALTLDQRKLKKYNEVVDIMVDIGREQCHLLGRSLRRKRSTPTKRFRMSFDLNRRCELFTELIEDLGTMCDSMVKEMDLTQQEMADRALMPKYYHILVSNIKKAAQQVLNEDHPSEKQVQQVLSKDMTSWILKASVNNDQGGGGDGMEALAAMSPEAKRNLRAQGISLKSLGLEDEVEEADNDDDDDDDNDDL